MKKNVIRLCIFICITSCTRYQPQLAEKEDTPKLEWQTLKIESIGQIITIDKYEEYGVRDTCDFKEVITSKSAIEHKPINIGREFFSISQQEKDSLFKYIYDIVTQPIYTDQYATCYAGNISIGFTVGQTTQICKYNSVGNWTTISPSTEKLYRLLKEKTKISEY